MFVCRFFFPSPFCNSAHSCVSRSTILCKIQMEIWDTTCSHARRHSNRKIFIFQCCDVSLVSTSLANANPDAICDLCVHACISERILFYFSSGTHMFLICTYFVQMAMMLEAANELIDFKSKELKFSQAFRCVLLLEWNAHTIWAGTPERWRLTFGQLPLK